MASVVCTAVLGVLVPSLGKLLKYEWKLSGEVEKGLNSLNDELLLMHAFLEDVSGMRPDKLHPTVQAMVRKVKELSSAIEPRLDSFMARIEATQDARFPAGKKRQINHEIASYVKVTLAELSEVHERYGPYPSKRSLELASLQRVGTRIFSTFNRESNPVGIAGAINEITAMLSNGDRVSIVGMGGLGKTTLARAVYEKMEVEFDGGGVVVHGGRTADAKKVLKDIFDGLQLESHGSEPDIYRLQNFLVENRCLIFIDDIWDMETWGSIEDIFKDSTRSKIITTTRNLQVAKQVGGVYEIKPLSREDSRTLLCTKIFGVEAKTHDAEFEEVSEKILNKCCGVPIAITSIGSCLNKNRSKGWHGVCEYIGFDELKTRGGLEGVTDILACSFYGLPYRIQKCFLHLSLFPEDHWIEKNMLIWRWVAEGLVPKCGEQKLKLFELGETYFQELIDRNMIQWAESPRDIGQGGCRVHYLMRDLICNLSSSSDENFSVVLGRKQESACPSPRSTIHRLAIHDTSLDQSQKASLELGAVLSFYASMCSGSGLPPLSRFTELRVMDLEDCDLSDGDCKLKQLEKLDEMAYLGLSGTHVVQLPKKIGRRNALETLDVMATGITKLLPFVEELGKLRCLRAGKGTMMTGQVGKLMSLEELWLHSADKSPNLASDLRKLTMLRVLIVHFDDMDEDLQEELVESLSLLKNLQVLQVWSDVNGRKVRLDSWAGSVPSPQLRQLLLFGIIVPRKMPWIHPSCVPELSKLLLQVEVLEAQDLEILGQMTSLRSLYIHSEEEDKNRLSYTARKEEFKTLVYLNTNIELVCGHGALPVIQELEVGGMRVKTDVGLVGNMPLLQRVTYHLDCKGCGLVDVKKAERALYLASKFHPNHPNLYISRWNNMEMETHNVREIFRRMILKIKDGDDGHGSQPQAHAMPPVMDVRHLPELGNLICSTTSLFSTLARAAPALVVADAARGTRTRSQGPSGDSENKIRVSVDLDQYIAHVASKLAELSGMDPTVLVKMLRKYKQNPKCTADGSISPSKLHRTIPGISEQTADGPGSDAGTFLSSTLVSQPRGGAADYTQGESNESFGENALPAGMTARDPAASRNMVEKAAGNKNPDAPSKSTENFKAGVNSQPRGLAEVMHYSLSPDAAAGLWEIATDFGISPVAYERLLKRWMQDPEFIPIVNSISSEPERVVMWLRRNANEEILWLYSSDGAASASETVALWGLPSSALVLRLYEKCMHTFLLNAEFDEESYESRERMFQLILPKLIDHVLEHEGEHELITSFSDILRDPAFGTLMARMLVTMSSAPQEISQKASFDEIDEDLILSILRHPGAAVQLTDGKDVPSGLKQDFWRIIENCMLNPQLISLMNSAMQSGDYSAVDQLENKLLEEQVKSMRESFSAVFTDNILACLSSSQFGADVATYAATDQTGIMDPAAVMNIVDKLTQDPWIFETMISVVREADGSPYGSYISGMAHVMMPDIISQLEQNADGPGSGAAGTSVDSSPVTTWPHTLVMLQVFEGALAHHARAAVREGWGDKSFEIDPKSVLAEIYSTVSHNALDFEDPAGYRIMWRQCMRNPEIIACMNSMAWTAGELGSGFSRLTMLMMPYFLSYLDQIKCGQDAARARAAGIEGSGGKNSQVEADRMLAMLDRLLAANALPGLALMDPAGYRDVLEKCLQNPEFVACMNSMMQNVGGSQCGSDFSRLTKLMMQNFMGYMARKTDGMAPVDSEVLEKWMKNPDIFASINNAARNGDRQAIQLMMPDIMDYQLKQYEDMSPSTPLSAMFSGLLKDPSFGRLMADTLASAAGAPSDSGQDDGENFSRMLKEVFRV